MIKEAAAGFNHGVLWRMGNFVVQRAQVQFSLLEPNHCPAREDSDFGKSINAPQQAPGFAFAAHLCVGDKREGEQKTLAFPIAT